MNIEFKEQIVYSRTNTIVHHCAYHVIFATKYRRPLLSEKIQDRLKEVVLDMQNEKFEIIEIETMPDHVHLLCKMCPTENISVFIKNIKGRTSKILREEFPDLKKKTASLWTRAKFISTVGTVSLAIVKQYISDQKGK